ncbi:MAG TPA: hypothetical protein PL089_05375 [Ignavibacteria bacterium]|nr:hypothetical protein [Ignavibacteria bacterium]
MKNEFFTSVLIFILFIFSIYSENTYAQDTGDFYIKLILNSNQKPSYLKDIFQTKDSVKPKTVYTPGTGLKVFESDFGSVNFSVFSYIRYLNQKGLDSNYTNAFGKTSSIKRRQDIQLNKVNIKFLGWFMDPKFRYLFYVWTSNTSIGQVTQVVVAGNLQYKINDNFNFGLGINGLPGVRSTSGNFPNWLPVDNRLIADEYFRPSYTTGVWANGNISEKLKYYIMWGNNLSQFGIDAGQLDAGLNTFSGMISWFPTTGEFGFNSEYSDFGIHKKAAVRIAGHFTYSEEDRESQPKTDEFENVQLRVSDGSLVFAPNLFGNGIVLENATYKMASVDAGVKYKGFALEGEYYRRWISNFKGSGLDSLGFKVLTDNGFQAMLSYMVIPEKFQLFTTFSQVFGEYGNPWDARAGFNFFPFKNRSVRWNFEYIRIFKSPVGALSLPYSVGATGGIFNTDFMVDF